MLTPSSLHTATSLLSTGSRVANEQRPLMLHASHGLDCMPSCMVHARAEANVLDTSALNNIHHCPHPLADRSPGCELKKHPTSEVVSTRTIANARAAGVPPN